MFSTWDRNPAAASQWLRKSDRRTSDPLAGFLASLDVMIYLAGAGFLACLIVIAFG